MNKLLSLVFALPCLAWAANPQVLIETNAGDLQAELYSEQAPITVDNFLHYVDQGYYDGLIFHRVIENYMIQGGGFNAELQPKRPDQAPIRNEAATSGLRNERGTLSMARVNDPHSATSQFFINHADNGFLDPSRNNPGYAVFGKLVSGEDVLDFIASQATGRQGSMNDVPIEPIVIISIRRLDTQDEAQDEPSSEDDSNDQ